MLAALQGVHAARDRALLVLGLKTGFRISEMLSLRVGDVLQHVQLVDHVTVARAHMKRKTEGRTVLLNRIAKEALAAWLTELGEVPADTYLFRSRQGENRPLSRKRAWALLKGAYRACGLTGKVAYHSLRKSFAKKMYEALNHDLARLQLAMGHKAITSTMSYLSFERPDIDSAISNL